MYEDRNFGFKFGLQLYDKVHVTFGYKERTEKRFTYNCGKLNIFVFNNLTCVNHYHEIHVNKYF